MKISIRSTSTTATSGCCKDMGAITIIADAELGEIMAIVIKASISVGRSVCVVLRGDGDVEGYNKIDFVRRRGGWMWMRWSG